MVTLHKRRYTDTCIYITPPAPLFTTARSRFSCSLPKENHHYRRLSLDANLASFHKKILNDQKQSSMGDDIIHNDNNNNNNNIESGHRDSTIVDETAYSSENNNNNNNNTQYAMATKSSAVVNNSHVSIDIKQQVPLKAIRIERDYSKGDGITQFSTEYPLSLEGKITLEQFRHTVNTINKLLYSAERLSWSAFFFNMMEILTIYLWPIFFSSHYQKTIYELLDFIDKENKQVYQKEQLLICNPVKTAFLFLEIQVFD
ncbi:Golgin subfamily A member 7/ERF4 family-domain-containing protein [Cunninghamella echinulata]|nr:Golgin subfamily A member 7/ERF4 family-domain-containing protein [Cunninghamella echinulata]